MNETEEAEERSDSEKSTHDEGEGQCQRDERKERKKKGGRTVILIFDLNAAPIEIHK